MSGRSRGEKHLLEWKELQNWSMHFGQWSDRLILHAFSTYLQQPQNRGRAPEKVLFEWLMRTLLVPPAPDDMIARVVHAEIALIDCEGHFGFEAKSDTGRQLLKSLTQYCRSFDHWQFSRWVHEVQASDFNRKFGS